MVMHWIYAHLIGDYLLQDDWMANGKKKSSWICTVHVASYMLPFAFTGLHWPVLALIAIEHWIQDRTNLVVWFMRFHGQQKFTEPPMSPWSIIVVDNILHILYMAALVALSERKSLPW